MSHYPKVDRKREGVAIRETQKSERARETRKKENLCREIMETTFSLRFISPLSVDVIAVNKEIQLRSQFGIFNLALRENAFQLFIAFHFASIIIIVCSR
jgi:hypothetical protein